jgi:hypothetical protein
MARIWPQAVNCAQYYLQEEDLTVHLPPIDEQERLLDLYFTYAHPVFPVLHKDHFMSQFNARCVRPIVICVSGVLPRRWTCSKNRYISKVLTSITALIFEPFPARRMREVRVTMSLGLQLHLRLAQSTLHMFPSYYYYPCLLSLHDTPRKT